MQITRFITRRLLGSAVLLLALSGCNRSEENDSSVATGSATPTKGAVTAPVKVDGKAGSNAPLKAPLKMTISQALGVNILKALNAATGMKGHTISVGTTPDTVILNGKVKNAAQKKMAETIARQKAKTAKVINKIEVSTK
jgi:osmotically-inducible protein OsmY